MKIMHRMYFLLFCLFSMQAYAAGNLVTSFNVVANKFAISPNSNVIYASTTHDNSVTIIDATSLTIVNSIFVGSVPAGLAVTPDGNTLYVALSGASKIAEVDLVTQSLVGYIDLPVPSSDVEVGNGRLYATPGVSEPGGGIMQVDLISKTFTHTFNEGVNIYRNGFLEISPDRNSLFFATRGLSPGTVAKFDVSTDTPSLLVKNPHGSLGSNGQDLALSRDGQHIYYAVGSGNGVTGTYDIAQLSAASFGVLGAFLTGHYPSEITVSPDGRTAYAVHYSGHIDVWSAETYLKLAEYPVSGEAVELITDHSGDYLFAAFTNVLRVYGAEGSEPVSDVDGDGVEDALDNCPDDPNPDQSDIDGDHIGDICDPFPTSDNHEFAQCSIELDQVSNDLAACQTELDALAGLQDSDNDGEINQNDKCPNTLFGEAIDDAGCSLAQFCSVYTGNRKACEKADWGNDEPLSSAPEDCLYAGGRKAKNAACVAAF